MADRQKIIKLLTEIAEYFRGCRDNVSFASKDENHFWELQNAANEAVELLKAQEQTPGEWVSVKDRFPAETHSIFWPWYGRKEWSNAMWREQSDKVLVTVTFKDGTCLVTTGETHDGEWHTSISKTLNPIVTHWMQMPEPPKEDKP